MRALAAGLLFCVGFLPVGCGLRPDPLVIADFETDASLDDVTWECPYRYELSSTHAERGTHSLRVDLPVVKYPRIEFGAVPADWSSYESVSIWIYLEGDEPVDAIMRIDDAKSDWDYGKRANMPVHLAPGPNRVEFSISDIKRNPSERPLNLEEIDRIILFLLNPTERRVLYVDDLRLTGAP